MAQVIHLHIGLPKTGTSFVQETLRANRRLLREGRISAVLHNDLRADARLALRLILQERGALPVEPVRPVPIQVITPYNIPTQG